MARNNPKQVKAKKLICFSDENSDAIEGILKDLHVVEMRSESAFIEDCIMQGLFPHNLEARALIRPMYCEDFSLNRTLSNIFHYAGSGYGQRPRYNNWFLLVNYCYDMTLKYIFSPESIRLGGVDAFVASFEEVISVLERSIDGARDLNKEYTLNSAKACLNQAKSAVDSRLLADVWRIIWNNWDELRDSVLTYYLMSNISYIHESFPDNPYTRIRLIRIMDEISCEWDKETTSHRVGKK